MSVKKEKAGFPALIVLRWILHHMNVRFLVHDSEFRAAYRAGERCVRFLASISLMFE